MSCVYGVMGGMSAVARGQAVCRKRNVSSVAGPWHSVVAECGIKKKRVRGSGGKAGGAAGGGLVGSEVLRNGPAYRGGNGL